MGRIERLTAWALAEGSTLGLGLFRIVVGLMVLRYLANWVGEWALNGFYGDYFFMPYSAYIPQPGKLVYFLVLLLGSLSAAVLIIGYRARAAAVICFFMVAYHFSLNQIWHRHNRYFLVLSLLLLCLSPCGRSLSLDALRWKLPPVGPLWTAFLIKAQMTLIYLASGISKTMDEAWRSGDVLTGRGLDWMWVRVMPQFVLDLIPPDAGVRLLTAQALASEFFLGIGLWFRQTRRLAIWWGILFHGFIEVRYSVQTFTYLSLGTYFLFADLRCGEKTWIYSNQRPWLGVVARLIPWLDWLFQLRLAAYPGIGHRFVDRDGTVYRGLMGWIMLGANIPVLYPLCYPLSWLRFSGWGRCPKMVVSQPAEPSAASASWITVWAVCYLAFLGIFNVDLSADSPTDAPRFWDLPWFFVLMCLVAAAYRRPAVSVEAAPATALVGAP